MSSADESYEQHLAQYFRDAGGECAIWSHEALVLAHRRAKEAARLGRPKQDFRYLRGYREFLGRVQAAGESTTVDIPQAAVRGAAKIGGKIVIAFLPGWAKAILAVLIAALGALDATDALPAKYDDMIEGIMALFVALGATSTRMTRDDLKPTPTPAPAPAPTPAPAPAPSTS